MLMKSLDEAETIPRIGVKGGSSFEKPVDRSPAFFSGRTRARGSRHCSVASLQLSSGNLTPAGVLGSHVANGPLVTLLVPSIRRGPHDKEFS
jgi:hypothetical protein